MRFIAQAELLKAALSRIDKVIEKRQIIPALGTVHCEAMDGLIRLTGTNLDTYVSVDVEAAVDEPGIGCIPAAELMKLVTCARKANVSVAATENVAVVSFGQAEAHLSLWPRDEFPVGSFDGELHPCDGRLLADALSFAVTAASNDPSRFTMCGVLLEEHGGSSWAVGTDGRHLHRAEMPGATFGISGQVIIPLRDVPLIQGLADGDGPFRAAFTDRLWAVESHGCRMRGKVVDGAFPDWRRVMGGERAHIATVDAGDFRAALGVATIGADLIEKRTAVVIDASGDGITLRSLRPGKAMTKASSATVQSDVHQPLLMTFGADVLAASVASEDSIAIFTAGAIGVDVEPAAPRSDLRLTSRVVMLRASEAEMAA